MDTVMDAKTCASTRGNHFTNLLFIKNTRLILLLTCLYSHVVGSYEIGDYYWQRSGLTFPDPGSACNHFLAETRASSPNLTWNLDEIVFLNPDFPHAGCLLSCEEGCYPRLVATAWAAQYSYGIDVPQTDTPVNQCVGNPIDPASGNKFQIEPLIQLDSKHPISFNLFFNSKRPEKWRHSYSQSVVAVTEQQAPVNAYYLASFCGDRTKLIESAGGFGDATQNSVLPINGYVFQGQPGLKILQAGQISAQLACEQNWSLVSNKFHYSWVNGSSSTYIGNGLCSIKDGNDIERMKVDIYRWPVGRKSFSDVNSCDDLDPTIPPQLDSEETINIRFTRNDGRLVRYLYNPVTLDLENQSDTGEKAELISDSINITGYRFYTSNDEIELYDASGRLQSITADDGHVQSLIYTINQDTGNLLLYQIINATGENINFSYETVGTENPFNRISSITDHDSRSWGFRFDVNKNLEYIDFPDTTTKQYHYEDGDNTDFLTGITDENGNRYASWTYNGNGKADSSAHGPLKNVDKVIINYAENTNQHNITIERYSELNAETENIVSVYKTHSAGGNKVVAAITGNNDVQFEHDPVTGNMEYKIEQGVKTEYSNYSSSGDPGTVIEAVATSEQRQTIYTYDPRYHSKIATVTEASVSAGNNKVTTYLYDDFGNNTEITIDGFKPEGTAVSRTTSFQYAGPYYQLSQIDGPRSDVSDVYSITYYPDDAGEGYNRARMKNVFSPLNMNLYSNITYTATGKIKTYLDANNVELTLDYFPGNGRLKSQQQHDLNTGEKHLTEWTYLATGEVKTITSGFDISDKATLTLNYDTARRLTGIVDGLGNNIEYILDSEGNVEQENIRDVDNALHKQLTQTFDSYNRLQLRTQVNENYTETWSADGTLDKTVDGKNVTTDYGYDSLRRLTQINQDMGGTSPQTADALTMLNYDVQDNLISVQNPVNGATVYSYDDLGNQLSQTSDDTGLTSYSYDDAGNITTLINANGETINYSYDALNRLTSMTTSNADDNYSFKYDSCKNGIGRLCRVSNNQNAQHYQYDAFGNVAAQQSLQYNYDTANRLKTITYPSGGIVQYDYNLAGQVEQVSLERNGSTTPLAANIAYQPFGDVSNLVYGSGLTLSQSKDTAYRPFAQSIFSVFELNYVDYDENGNLKQRDDAIASSTSLFAYDEHNRLSTATGEFGSRSYSYDKNANRTALTEDSNVTDNTYQPQSNRLTMRGLDNVSLDNNGNTLSIGERGYSYTKHNRLFEVFDNGVLKATYQYNGLGQRTSKTMADGSGKYFIYDTDGKLMAETDINGNVLFEYIYLNGQLLAKYSPDTDIDGINNAQEDQQGSNPVLPDQDGDGLSDLDEIFIHGTSIYSGDSDNDGVGDSEEVAFNSDPLDDNTSYGDINLNGEFNVGDYVLLMQFVLGTRTPSPTEQEQADINQDGTLNIQDLLLMQRVLLGLQLSWFNFSVDGLEEMFAQLYQNIIPQAYAADGDGDIYFVHNDYLGTPVKMTDMFGIVVWTASFDPFGKAVVDEDVDGDGASIGMNVRFPGQYYDGESGLHYNYFRTYDPELGRYLTSDPIGLFGGINTYGYVFGNPNRYIDPQGLMGSISALHELGENSNNKQEAYNNYIKNPTNENLQKWMDADSATPGTAANAVKESADAYYGRGLSDALKRLLPDRAKKIPNPEFPNNDENGSCPTTKN